MSLLDDPAVLAGLESMEPAEPRGSAASDPVFHASVHDLDSGLTVLSSPPHEDQLPQFGPEPSVFADHQPDGELDAESDDEPIDWKTTLRSHSGIWVFCGTLGAAAAALVFHAEVSRLMWSWSGAAASLWR
jgi:hypothetical protein